LHAIGQATRTEDAMKLQFDQKQLVLGFSKSPLTWFHSQTRHLRLTSLSLLFVQLSWFARQPSA
jgi:hypothetical protein